MSSQATRRSIAGRMARTAAGGALLAAGLALLILPGPGLLLIAVAVSILATDHTWARRLLHRIKRPSRQAPAHTPAGAGEETADSHVGRIGKSPRPCCRSHNPRPPPGIGQDTNGAAEMHTPPLAVPPATVSRVNDRLPSTGGVLALFTGGPTDTAVAHHTAELAQRTGAPVVAAATVRGSGFSMNALPHRVRDRRIAAETAAIIDRVGPTLRRATPWLHTTTLTVPSRGNPHHLPTAAVHRLAARIDATTVVLSGSRHRPIHGA